MLFLKTPRIEDTHGQILQGSSSRPRQDVVQTYLFTDCVNSILSNS